ncbi:hypothetical protein CHLRE_10g449150v5 [Chlamydomonas reinhardtii]|uniref:Uncharacterized protein n=1 Tax=Chlamydomonas reinhardtii TaxID=3055 RepID=A0A2K3DB33_CHLRE|nr:uncharacterized protein CHLRE_10g449150v5 [Chlamydomonas reinhardtii]PNW77731.1 hypothetical protein CHLRE_10g449150v5 [Chlamydomonas reinhardtii]
MRDMTLEMRRKLLCATAASGDLANLELALSVVGCPLGPDVFTAAVSSPVSERVAVWLLERRCRIAAGPALEALARSGRMHGDPLFDDVFSRGKFSTPVDNLLSHIAAAGAGYITDKFSRMVDVWRNNPLHLEAAIAAARGGHAQLVTSILDLPHSSSWVGMAPPGSAAALAAASPGPGHSLVTASAGLGLGTPVVVAGASNNGTPSSTAAVSRSTSMQKRSNEEQVQTAALRLLEAVVEGLGLEDMAAVYAAWFDPSDPAYRQPAWQVLPCGRRRGCNVSGACSGSSSRARSPSPTRLDFSSLALGEAPGACGGEEAAAAAMDTGQRRRTSDAVPAVGRRDGAEAQLQAASLAVTERVAAAAALERKPAVDELLLAAAAGSRTEDWTAKVVWLLGRGHVPQQSPHHAQAAARAAACPDALERLQWLHAYQGADDGVAGAGCEHWRHRFLVCYPRVAAEALANGRTDALRYVLRLAGAGAPGLVAGSSPAPADYGATGTQCLLVALATEHGLFEGAAAAGRLECLQLLHAAGCRMPCQAMALAAARHGRGSVLRWLLDVYPVATSMSPLPGSPSPSAPATAVSPPGVRLAPALCTAAARSGSLEVLQVLRGRGCPWDADAVVAAAEAGSEAVLEYLVVQGCPAPSDERVYAAPLAAEDLLTLRCLRRLGLPFRREPAVFARAVAAKHSLPLLKWLYETGVPVDLEALLERALDGNAHDMEWEAWLQSELEAKKRRQQEQEAELEAGRSKGAKFKAAMKRALSIKRRNAPPQQQPKQKVPVAAQHSLLALKRGEL